jgi:4,5-dihydroxyphthalate decarboxylase
VSSDSSPVSITLGIHDYDHVRDLVSGAVPVQGARVACLQFEVEELFFRFPRFREWDVSELSLAKYASLRAAGDDSLVGIPVFTSRAFRHSAIFIRDDGPADDPSALRGGRIGVPEWTQTATVYARGVLQHEFGVGLGDVTWVQAGTNEPGRTEGVAVTPPQGVTVEPIPDRTLNDMLLEGDIDALIAAHPPTDFKRDNGGIRRLFTDFRAVEEASYRATGVFPIMHLIVLKAELHERHRWLAANLMSAFERAKAMSVTRARDYNAPSFPVPWGPANVQRAEQIFGPDFWPYGVEPNRTTLEAFLGLAAEQGVCSRPLAVDELFPPEVLGSYKI